MYSSFHKLISPSQKQAELAWAQKPEAKKSRIHFPKVSFLKFFFTIFYHVLFEFQFLLMGFLLIDAFRKKSYAFFLQSGRLMDATVAVGPTDCKRQKQTLKEIAVSKRVPIVQFFFKDILNINDI